MKIAVLKIGANITFSSANKSAANADIKYALKTINNNANSITIISKKTRNTIIPKEYKFAELKDVESLDAADVILVFNGSINFFGGAFSPEIIKTYQLLNKTTSHIMYVQTDGAMWFQQLWPLIYKREWAKHYNESDFHISGDKVIYLTQGRDMKKVHNELLTKKYVIYPKEIFHYPWETTILQFDWDIPRPWFERAYDLGFGGATRNSYKRKLIEKYYNSPILKNLLFGNLRGVDCFNAQMQAKVSYQQFIPKMSRCKATVAFGDKFYNNNFHTLRMYENILAGCLMFVDSNFCDNFYKDITEHLQVTSLREVEQYLLSNSPNNTEDFANHIRRTIIARYNRAIENEKINTILRSIT